MPALPRRLPAAAALAVIVATSLYTNLYLLKREVRVERLPLSDFPRTVGAWKGEDIPLEEGVPGKLGLDEYLYRRYTDGKVSVWLYIGYYDSQSDGAVPHSPRHCYPGSGWDPVGHSVEPVAVPDSMTPVIRPNRYVFRRGEERQYVVYWYQARGRVVANEYVEKAYLVWDSVFRRRSDGALVRFSMGGSHGDDQAAFRTLDGIVGAIYPLIPSYVPN